MSQTKDHKVGGIRKGYPLVLRNTTSTEAVSCRLT